MKHDRRCSVCCRFLTNARRARWPDSTTCGESECQIVNKRRVSAEYVPPADGSPECADPLFRAKLRPCGRCGFEFRQTVHWRYFCPRCRQTAAVRHPEPDRTYELSSDRRAGGG